MTPSEMRILHADARSVVVDKPAGLLSVPGRGDAKADCVAARVRTAFPDASGPLIVHRLDMDTSGLMILGLDPAAQRFLSAQFERRRVEKVYTALVAGDVQQDQGLIDLPLRPDWPNRPRQIVADNGRASRTRYRVASREIDRTRLRIYPETGRTHQIRVHVADPRGLGHPILGDPLYSQAEQPGCDPVSRLMLHASTLGIRLPGTRRLRTFESQPPF
ncbi:MAG: RluA family pseudouridine synthase [Planctomycetota bacterium]